MCSRKEHIEKLAAELGCRLVIDPKFKTSAMMYVEFGYVEVPPPDNQIDYLLCLHELGHVYHGHTQGRPPKQKEKFYFDNGVLRSEAQAWEWALDNCPETLTDESRRFMWDRCLGTYYQYGYVHMNGEETRLLNGNRAWVSFVYDKPDEYFSSIVSRIQGSLKDFLIQYKG